MGNRHQNAAIKLLPYTSGHLKKVSKLLIVTDIFNVKDSIPKSLKSCI